jgi:hypothetical protein
VLVAACAAQVGDERNGTSEQAMLPGDDSNEFVICPIPGPLGANAFEDDLLKFGCTGKVTTTNNGPGHYAYYQTYCPTGTTATFVCPTTNTSVTGHVSSLVSCYHSIPPYYAERDPVDLCGREGTAPSGNTFVIWDPTCSGGGCSSITRD